MCCDVCFFLNVVVFLLFLLLFTLPFFWLLCYQPPVEFHRGLDLEKLCAQLGQSERGAQGELLRAQEREQLSRVTFWEL